MISALTRFVGVTRSFRRRPISPFLRRLFQCEGRIEYSFIGMMLWAGQFPSRCFPRDTSRPRSCGSGSRPFRVSVGLGLSPVVLIDCRSHDVDRERIAPSPPTQTGRADLRHPAFQFMAFDGLAQALDSRFRRSRTSRAGLRPAHLFCRRSTVDKSRAFKPGIPARPGEQPCGTTRTLVGCLLQSWPHHVPTPLRSTVITRFLATTRALTPTDPYTTGRGSLIHVIWTSDHSVSNHLRLSTSRYPLTPRWQLYFVRTSPFPSRLVKDRRPNRVYLHYGLVVHFQLLSTRGYRPGAVTFSYWPFSVGQAGTFTRLSTRAFRRTRAGAPRAPMARHSLRIGNRRARSARPTHAWRGKMRIAAN